MRASALLRSPYPGVWLYPPHQPVCINRLTHSARIVTALASSHLITSRQQVQDMASSTSGSPPGVAAPLAATLAVQNMVQLCKDLKLPVTYKANEVVISDSQDRTFRVVVHAHSDHAFKKYLNTCATTDLMLYRGMLLTVTTDREIQHVKGAYVQQAFLPKFENEGQDSSIADQIVQQADQRYMVVTIKHSGSLVTLSSEGFAAKNSIGNEYTAGAALLLRAHFDRLHGEAQGAARLKAFMALLQQRQMAVSFEMVTACHGHHGQLPAAEYLVATAAQVNDPGAGRPAFLGWQDFLSFCLEQGLPVNDTWLFQGRQWAAAARTLLDDLALSGGVTAIALNRLNQLVQDGTSSGCLHVCGTYPHDQWQGSRLEGFVVAQGQPYSVPLKEALQHLSSLAGRQAISLPSVPDTLRAPYKALTLQLAAGASLTSAPSGNAMVGTNGTDTTDSRGKPGSPPSTNATAVPATNEPGPSAAKGKGRKGKKQGLTAAQPAETDAVAASATPLHNGAHARASQEYSIGNGPKASGTGPSSGPAAEQQAPAAGSAGPAASQLAAGPATSQPAAGPAARQPQTGSSNVDPARFAPAMSSGRMSSRGLNVGAPSFVSAVAAAHASASAANGASSRPQSAAAGAVNGRQTAAAAAASQPATAGAARQPASTATAGNQRQTANTAATAAAVALERPVTANRPKQPAAVVAAAAATSRPASSSVLPTTLPLSSTAPPARPQDITSPAEVAAGADGGTGKAPAKAAAPANLLVEYIAQQQESWLPHPKMESKGGSDTIISRLLEVKAPGPLVQLPNGSYMVVRAALAACSDPAAVLSQAHQLILQQHKSGAGLHPQLDDKAVKKVVQEVEACIKEHQERRKQTKSGQKGNKEEGDVGTANSQLAIILARAPRVVLGAPDLGTALRYKKKMMMWRIAGGGTMARAPSTTMTTQASMDTRDSSAPPEAQASMDIDAPAAGTSATGTSGGGATQSLDSMSGVGYCLMTFVIRNGLQSLNQGLQQYMGYVGHLARAWGLPGQHVAQVNMFARAWAGWAAKHGGVKASAQYLDVAEPFVAHFLDCMARGDMESLLGTTKAKDTFQGVLLLLDESNIERAKEVQAALSADNLIDLTPAAQKGKKPTPCPPFSKSMVTQGTVIVHPPGMTLHKDLPEFLTHAGRSAFCAVVRNTDDADFQTVKRVSGTTQGNRKKIEAIFAASASGGGAGTTREKLLEAAYRPQEVVSWLGKGVPLPTTDPSAICCFVSIPGVGKTFLTEGLKSLPGVTSVSLRLLNGDRLKKGGQPPARFWYDVAGKASTTLGNGNVTVVVGDKNLVPSPPGNIQRAVTTLSDSGAVTVALVPSWSGTPQQDVGVAYPDLPFPLELIALCMLRVLQRKNHEGGLDHNLGHAMTVMIMFALFFKNLSRDDLMSMLKTQFSVVVEMPVLALDSTDPNKQIPLKLLRLIAEGLGQFKESGKPQLPDAWEREMRAQLLENDTKKRLLALQVPAEQSRACISQALVQGLQEAQAIARGDSDAEAKALLRSLEVKTEGAGGQLPRYIAVSGQDEGALRDTVNRLIPGLELNMFSKNQFHVTLWHALDPVMGRDHAMRDELLAARGMPVEMQIVSIDHAPGKATAAQVQLLNAPEAAFTKPYHHITLAIAPGGTAKDANRLPEWIEAGQAERFELSEPLTLMGVVEGLS